MYRLLICNGEEHFRGYDAAHGVADEDGADRGVDCGGGCVVGDFEVDDFVLEPARTLVSFFQSDSERP